MGDFVKNMFEIGLRPEAFELICFKLDLMTGFDNSVNDSNLQWRSQGYGEARTCAGVLV